MKRKLVALLITLALLVGTYSTAPFILNKLDQGMPKASLGELDLTDWNFAQDGVAALNGEWEFYPDQLLTAADFDRGTLPSKQMVTVPGSWSSKMKTIGKATYRLRVHITDASQIYGLKTLSIQMSSRIFVNGQVVGTSGDPAERQSYVGKNKPVVSYFALRPGMNEVIVQAANFHSPPSSGINHSIFLGYQNQIADLQSKALSHDWIRFTAYLIMGLYFIGLYTQRRKDYFLICFGLLSIFFAVFIATLGERIVYELFPSMPVWLFLRIQIIVGIFGSIALLLYIYLVFHSLCSKRLIWITLIAGTLLSVLELGFFSAIQTDVMRMISTMYINFAFLYFVYVLVLTALHRVEGSLYMAAAAIALNVHQYLLNLNVYFGVPVYTFPPVEPFVYLITLALLMSLRFSNAFKQIEQLSGRLIRADKLKDEFLTKTAHEFKTPLHGIINITQAVIDDRRDTLSRDQQENVELVSVIAKRLSRIVYDILDFSKLKEGELAVHLSPVDVRSTVEVVLKVFSFLTAGKEVRLVNSVPANLPYVLADESRLRQILNNLVDNAIKHTEFGRIEVTAVEHGGMIEISVQDTGIGMDEREFSIIFEPYKSVQMDASDSFGLGLAIVKQLLDLQHGHIHVASKKGAGSTFTFSLPMAGGEESPNAAASQNQDSTLSITPEYSFPTPYVSQQKGVYTILVVDDNFSNLKVLIDALERLNYTVIAVKNGYEALKQMESRHSVDLVILDLMMPGMTGFEVCRILRNRYSMLELPILMVTASIQAEDKIAAFDVGANDYLPKPFDVAELRSRAKSLLVMKESARKAVDLEVAFLQSQIKPHFLYNVLNTIMATSYMDVDKSRKLTTDLADYLRGSFAFSNVQQQVSFSSELALIRSYTEIERVRFKDRIRVDYEIADDVLDVKISPLLIQPLVENAIRHGLGSREDGGTVTVRAYKTDGNYIFEVKDDGIGMTAEQVANIVGSERLEETNEHSSRRGVGLRNISKRLKLTYGTELQMQSVVGIETKVTIRIPDPAA